MASPPKFDPDNTDNANREVMQGIVKLLLAIAAVTLLVIDVHSQTSQDLRKILAPDFGFWSYGIYVADFAIFYAAATNFLRARWLFFPHPAPERR